jgi:hypothetical protein
MDFVALKEAGASPAKFTDADWTAKGEPRAKIALKALETLWFNTGTLCNIACLNCYIESSPRNDRLAYLSLADVTAFLDEIARDALPVKLIGFTGGEPFMNRDFPAILGETLRRGFETLTLTNAMKPLALRKKQIAALVKEHGARMRLRVSLDDFRPEIHDAERGEGSFATTIDGLKWLSGIGATVEVAGRFFSHDNEAMLRAGYARLFRQMGIGIDAGSAPGLLLLPEMNPEDNPPEITEACWGILHKSPGEVMCANARMVVKRKGAASPSVLACTLLPYDPRFELGGTLKEARGAVPLTHPYCASFCVLGGGSCGAKRAEN